MIKRFFSKLARSLQFAKFGWNNFDWDNYHLLDLIRFKLERMRIALKDGMCDHNKTTTQSLRVAVKLLERILEDDYGRSLFNQHDAKWGEFTYYFKDLDDKPTYSEMKINRDKVVTEEDKTLEKAEIMKIHEMSETLRGQDLSKLFNIMNKYHGLWWT